MRILVLVVSVSLVTALLTAGPVHDHRKVPLLSTVHVKLRDDCTESGSVWFGDMNWIGVAGKERSEETDKIIIT